MQYLLARVSPVPSAVGAMSQGFVFETSLGDFHSYPVDKRCKDDGSWCIDRFTKRDEGTLSFQSCQVATLSKNSVQWHYDPAKDREPFLEGFTAKPNGDNPVYLSAAQVDLPSPFWLGLAPAGITEGGRYVYFHRGSGPFISCFQWVSSKVGSHDFQIYEDRIQEDTHMWFQVYDGNVSLSLQPKEAKNSGDIVIFLKQVKKTDEGKTTVTFSRVRHKASFPVPRMENRTWVIFDGHEALSFKINPETGQITFIVLSHSEISELKAALNLPSPKRVS